ncbi:MAG TPA: VirB8/TrbF family protein [Croceibacterium sp.]|nr:VirB8/TrbF family protein [Croceibacterium sp.]
MSDESLEEYYREAETWSHDRQRAADRSVRIAWIVAGVAALVALIEAAALFLLIPLKRDVPYTLLVDRQTGYVQALRPFAEERISADSALTRSFLVQYVIARESFDSDSLQESYRKVGLWSAGDARERYVAAMSATNPQSPLATLPRRATVDVTIRSVTSLSPSSAMVRFSTVRTDPGGRPQMAQNWAAVISFRYSAAGMSEADRLTNPLGFQVTRYRRDAETLPEAAVRGLPEAEPIPTTVEAGPAR